MKKLQDHLQLEVFPDRSDYFQNGFKLGFGVWGERFVEAWPAETCLFSDAGHSYRLSHMAKHNSGYFMIAKPEKALWDKMVLTSGVMFRSKLDVTRYLEEDLRIDLSDLSEFDWEEMKSWIPFSPKKSSLFLFIQTLEKQ